MNVCDMKWSVETTASLDRHHSRTDTEIKTYSTYRLDSSTTRITEPRLSTGRRWATVYRLHLRHTVATYIKPNFQQPVTQRNATLRYASTATQAWKEKSTPLEHLFKVQLHILEDSWNIAEVKVWQHFASQSQALVERLCSVCGMLSHGKRNRMEKSLEMKVWLKVNFSVLRELEYKKTWQKCFGMSLLTVGLMFHVLLANWNPSVSWCWIVSLSCSQWINLWRTMSVST